VHIRYFVSGTLAALCTSAVIAAQAPGAAGQQPTTQQPTTQQPSGQPPSGQPAPEQPTTGTRTQPQAATQQAATTVTGCVYREQDVAGRAPNVAERVGVLEDYILAVDGGAQASGGQAQAGATASGGATTGAVGTSGSAAGAAAPRMYKLEFASDEQLGAMVGKRVTVTGRIDAEAGDSPTAAGTPTSTTDRVLGRARVDLAEFVVVSIKEATGSCPARPAAQ
jgi:hypothetical protein